MDGVSGGEACRGALQRRAKRRNQPGLRKTTPGRIFSGELRRKSVFSVGHSAPGPASGSTWLGQT